MKRRRPSVKNQIEKTPEVTRRELLWTKKIGAELKQVATRGSTLVKIPAVPISEFTKAHFVVHSHPSGHHANKLFIPNPMLGVGDALRFVELIKAGKAKTGVIASLDNKGKVAGYTICRFKKPLPFLSQKDLTLLNLDFLLAQQKAIERKDWSVYTASATQALKKVGVHLKQRFVPMPGYKFNKKAAYFEKTHKPKKS